MGRGVPGKACVFSWQRCYSSSLSPLLKADVISGETVAILKPRSEKQQEKAKTNGCEDGSETMEPLKEWLWLRTPWASCRGDE